MSNQPQNHKPTPDDFFHNLQQPNPTRTSDQQTQSDTQATQLLLDFYRQDDGWHCPRCQQVFIDPTAFAQHLQEEIRKSWAALSEITPKPKPPREKP